MEKDNEPKNDIETRMEKLPFFLNIVVNMPRPKRKRSLRPPIQLIADNSPLPQ